MNATDLKILLDANLAIDSPPYRKQPASLRQVNVDTFLKPVADAIDAFVAANAGGGGVTNGDKGDITVSGAGLVWTIDNDVVTLAKMANIASSSFIGRVSGGTGDPEALTVTQATSLLNTFTDALKGLVPASGGGTANFLRADGTFAAPPSSPYSSADKLVLEMEMAFKTSNLLNHKTFAYSGETLTGVSTWVDDTLGVQLFQLDLTYNGSNQLSTTVLTRISDSATLTKTLTYSGDQLVSIERS